MTAGIASAWCTRPGARKNKRPTATARRSKLSRRNLTTTIRSSPTSSLTSLLNSTHLRPAQTPEYYVTSTRAVPPLPSPIMLQNPRNRPQFAWRASRARRLGKELPEGVAFGPDGRPTRDPAATLDGGAIRAWGGAKGSGLAIVVQLLGAMCASPPMPQGMYDYGCLFV